MRCPGVLSLLYYCHSPESLGFPIIPSPVGLPGDAEAHGLSPLGSFCPSWLLYWRQVLFSLSSPLGAELGHHQDAAGTYLGW